VPLEVGYFRAADVDILTGPGSGFFFLDLELNHLGRVLDDLRNVSPVARANFTQDTLVDPDHATNQPVALRRPIRM